MIEPKMAKKVIVACTTALFLIVVSFSLGITVGKNDGRFSASAATPENSVLNADLSVLWETVGLIKEKYFDAKNIKDQDLLYGAIEGVVKSLDDPYSDFFNPGDAKKFYEDLNGSFGGIGAEIGMKEKEIVIIAPLKNNPAEAAGLKAGDKIIKIDDKVTTNMSVEDSVKIIRGEPGTEVRLMIFREGWKETKEFKITRKVVVVPTLDWEMKPDGIAYFRLYNFNANVPSLFFDSALKSLVSGTTGIVLDLRNNPGGFLDVATNLSGWFLPRGEIAVKERFYSSEEKNFYANGNQSLANIPVVVLVNEGSASASEILAGALRDQRGAKLVGEKTYGKGTVQEVDTLKDGSSIKISIAEWLTPNGHSINKRGLTPDVEVKITEDDIKNKKDPQLEKAIELLKEVMIKK
ncbi:MAG: S41 family peptidase [Patescibacteria group bacterium]